MEFVAKSIIFYLPVEITYSWNHRALISSVRVRRTAADSDVGELAREVPGGHLHAGCTLGADGRQGQGIPRQRLRAVPGEQVHVSK